MNDKFRLVEFQIKEEHISDFKTFILKKKMAKEAHGALPMIIYECTNRKGMFFVMTVAPPENAEEGKMHLTSKLEDMFLKPINKMELKAQPPGVQDEIKTGFMVDEAVDMFFIFHYKPEYKDELLKAFDTHVVKTREEPGNILFDFFTVENQDNIMVVHEYWKTKDDLWDVHMNLPHSKEIGELMAKAMVGKMEDELYYIKPLD